MNDIVNFFKKLFSFFTDFIKFIVDLVSYCFDYALGIVQAIFTRLFFFLWDFFQFIVNPIIEKLDNLVKSIGLEKLSDYYDVLARTGFAYILDYFMIPDFLTAILFAYVVRFTIRRLPFVG